MVQAMRQMDLIESLGCQRWNRRRELYRTAGEPIDTSKYGVELVSEGEARTFVQTHHYAGSLPPTRVRVGLFRSEPFRCPELVGVAVFSVPVQAKALSCYFGVGNEAGVELGRLVLKDSVEANGETFFVSRACKLLKQQLPGVKAVLSYSDPLERRSADGYLVKRGHYGTVYRGLSATFMGRSSKRTLVLDRHGRVISERSLSKLRNDESGAAGAYRMLIEAGAPRRMLGESGREYVERVLKEGPFTKQKHPGNLVFGWGVGSKGERSSVRKAMKGLAYPPYPELALQLAA
jgi:hypothetical protein